MRKKYFTEEEKRLAKNLQQQKYYNKIKKEPLPSDELEKLKWERVEKRKKYIKEYYIKNKEKISKNGKDYFKKNKKEKQKKNNENYKKRRLKDPLFKLTTNIRRSIRGSLKGGGYTKKSKTYEILGCTYVELKEHLELQWKDWMCWDNHGKYNGELDYGWDVDHIIPISSAETEEDIILLNHYTNLQPLCSYMNRVIKRGDNIITIKKENNVSSIYVK